MSMLDDLEDRLRLVEEEAARGKRTPEWWTVSGYRLAITEVRERIRKHERRAVRIYGDQAPLFKEVAETNSE